MFLFHRSIRLIGVVLMAGWSVSFAQSDSNPGTTATALAVVSYAYVGSNTTPGTITAYRVLSDGSASVVSAVRGPARSLNVSSGYVFGTDGRYITTYTRNSNGSLRRTSTIDGTAHNDTPQGSAVGSMQLDRSGRTIYAGEINFQGTDNDAYAFFTVGSGGKLSFLENSGISVNYDYPLVFSQSNKYAYGIGCYFAGWDLFGFTRSSDGDLMQFDPQAGFPPNPNGDLLCPGSIAASAQGYAVVSYGVAQNGSKQSLISYRINADGTLTVLDGTVQQTQLTYVPGLWFDPTGTYLAAAGQNGLYVFRLSSNGMLTRIGSRIDPTVQFSDVKWDKTGHLYALSAAKLYIFNSKNGVLTPAPGSPHVIAKPASLAVLPIQ